MLFGCSPGEWCWASGRVKKLAEDWRDWFAHKLCWQFGIPSPDWLAKNMSARQFTKWVAFYCRENGIKLEDPDDQEVLATKFKALAAAHAGIKGQLDGRE